MSIRKSKRGRSIADLEELDDFNLDDELEAAIDEDVEMKDERDNNPFLDEKTIVISGIFDGISRAKLEEYCTQKGARVTGSVSGKTDLLVVGWKMEDGREITDGGKYKKALKMSTTILTEV